jgi:putative methionine-R-sulfoxide reductase with GAF domain
MISRFSSHIESREISEPFLQRLIRGQTIGIGILVIMVSVGGIFDHNLLALLPLGGLAVIVGLIASLILRRGHFLASGYLFFIGTSIAISINVYIRGYQDASTIYYLWPILGAVSILEGRGGLVVLITSLLSYLFLAIGQRIGFLNPPIPFDPRGGAFLTMGSFSIMFSLLAYLAWLSSQNTRQALNQAHQAARKLQDINTTLESLVTERTKALATSAEVTRRLATVLDPSQLVSAVVNEVRNAFDYYYAQIYLLDEAGENLVMSGGTGEAGAVMLARGHSLPKGRGLVGRAADTNTSVLVPDVSQEEGWLPNDLLPETKAEAAVPISAGKRVLGVLDVQHSLVNGLTAEDVTLLESLAGQVAITLQNARAYEESRRQAELESLVNVIGQKIQRTTTMEDTLQTAIREIGAALGAARVSASISRPASEGKE